MAKAKEIYCEHFNMGAGKCQCPGYVENPSKWSKGKCNRCTHAKSLHKLDDQEQVKNDENDKQVSQDSQPEIDENQNDDNNESIEQQNGNEDDDGGDE
eukprot:CAMPEP_0202687744 /NCGR_PEP_ID=MMETSP1385-20130828/3380_1 /ASSEMBLY_ACC=CAM_ASM_000861 /TAXON_ID=933848 /ORGANISM="Elphidium margaritaceum" /LENGTH=97 /DNA_ID=CAMNT_0049342587 /DNA_START=44 /DNA_END=337 /DNA_ORIENTATION=+